MSTITKEFTKEQLQQIIETDHVQCGEASALARIALASLEAEAVCVIDQSNLDYLKSGSDADVWPASRAEMGDVLLYRSATPAPVSVPECFKRLLHHAYGMTMGHDWNKGTMAGHHRDKLCHAVEDCRAAMLHGGNSPVIQDGWVACVERMPSAGEQVLAYRPDAPESNDPLIKMATYVGGSAHGHGFDCYCKPTHWMPLPAAPQQEVK